MTEPMGMLHNCPACGVYDTSVNEVDESCKCRACGFPALGRLTWAEWQDMSRPTDKAQWMKRAEKIIRGLISDSPSCVHCADDPDPCWICIARVFSPPVGQSQKQAPPESRIGMMRPDGRVTMRDDRPCSVCATNNVRVWRCDTCKALVCDVCHVNGDCKTCYESGAHLANMPVEDFKACLGVSDDPDAALKKLREIQATSTIGSTGALIAYYNVTTGLMVDILEAQDKRLRSFETRMKDR